MRHLLIMAALAAAVLIAGCGQPEVATPASGSPFAPPSSLVAPYPGPTILPYPMPVGGSLAAPVAIDYAAPNLGVVINKDMRVLAVDRWGVAERAGIQPGDRLEEIDGLTFFGNTAKAKQHIHTVTMEQKSIITLTRNGQTLHIELVLWPAQRGERPIATDGRPPPTATPVAPEDDYL